MLSGNGWPVSMGRDSAGRFTPGFNPDRGRGPVPASRKSRPSPDLANAVLYIASTSVAVRGKNGRRKTMSLFEALVRRIASGQSSRRTSVADFIYLTIECAGRVDVLAAPADDASLAPPALPDRLQQWMEKLLAGLDDDGVEP